MKMRQTNYPKKVHLKNAKKQFYHLLMVAGLMSFAIHSDAQQPCDMVSSIGINTGYNYVTNTVLTSGTDPNWQVVALSSYCQGLTTNTPPYPASIPGFTSPGANSSPISFLPTGTYTTNGTEPVGSLWMTLERTFKTCTDDSITFNIKIADDNYCTGITVDNVSVPPSSPFSQPAGYPSSNYLSMHQVQIFTMHLSAGVHKIDVTVDNYPIAGDNPHSLVIIGTVSSASGTSSIEGPLSTANCSCPVPSPDCSDSCYWKVRGNNILGGNNIFGTLTKDAIRIQTSSANRGIMTADGLFGWNTISPTAYLHINCAGHNPDDGSGGLSDVRFEKLEPGTKGNILIIDPSGYVYDTKIPLQKLTTMQAQNAALQSEVEALRSQIDNIASTVNIKTDAASSNSKLYQNTPNPFNSDTKIDYYIDKYQQGAFIVIYDLNGRQLNKYGINTTGKGTLTISSADLQPGMYIYSLVIDGQQIDSKKMTIVR